VTKATPFTRLRVAYDQSGGANIVGSGLVERRAHPTDRRATLVTLTAAGSQLAAAMDPGYQAIRRERVRGSSGSVGTR
jgi:hypothetical protein